IIFRVNGWLGIPYCVHAQVDSRSAGVTESAAIYLAPSKPQSSKIISMKAITIKPGVADSILMRETPDPDLKDKGKDVTVKVLRTGLCGTDADIYAGEYGEAPPGEDYLILGHENFGVVEDPGSSPSLKPGDYVVATVRRPCGKCLNCQRGEMDLCTSGEYTERGIKGRHGYMAEYYTESPQYLIRIPPELRDVGVLLEPTSVVEKGIDHVYLIQRRMNWQPERALVLGAGPVGLLAAAVLRVRGLKTFIVGRETETDLRAQLAESVEADYLPIDGLAITDLPKKTGPLDIVIEATGVSSVVFGAMQILAPDGILCLLSVTGGHAIRPEPTDRINQDLVLGNNVVFGSVNANPRHFQKGVEDFQSIEKSYPGMLPKLITSQLDWKDYGKWFGQKRSGIKTTLEISTG
ncbi:MAG: glucose 1-dehydrogenase, partial [Terriglobia bacterium]